MSKIVFRYRGLDQQGAETRGTVEALDKEDALKKLRSLEAEGLCDLSIEGVQQLNGNAPSASAEPSRRFCGSCGAENLVTHSFCASCGKPLGDAVQGQPAAQTAQGKQQHSNPPPKPWQWAVILLCLGVTYWSLFTFRANWSSFTTVMPESKSAPRPSASQAAATQAANNRRLETIMLDKYHDIGVVKVEVDGLVMYVHVTPEVYRAMLSDRVQGNQIMRGWQKLLAQNNDSKGVGGVWLYCEGNQVATADLNIWSGEIKVTWYDQ